MISVHRYRLKLEKEFGYASPILMQEYADARQKYKRGKQDFNPFTSDPNCKTCGKDKGK
jgi:hypothetical protein